MKTTKQILVAPLDWGLGHTTRCIPLIRHLSASGHRVLFAGNEPQRAYIDAAMPGLPAIHLEGYNVRYATRKSMFMPAIMKQVPGILSTIKREHEWLKGIVADHNIDAVISDNRYGLYHDIVPSVIMTHQLQVQTGMGKTSDNFFRKLHYRYLEKFDECWVVDEPTPPGLAGMLSHPEQLPANTTYLGLLSQQMPDKAEHEDELLVLLSGPEPQRSILSDKIWTQVKDYNRPVVFVEGSNHIQPRTTIPVHVTYHKQLAKDELAEVFHNAEMVICRSGYSTIMDLLRMGKKAILIPTPGQTEQEYLGKILQDHCMFMCHEQNDFNLAKAIEQTRCFPFLTHHLEHHFDDHKAVADKWIDKI